MDELIDALEQRGGIVYVLSNEAMPGLIKIGRTSGEGVGRRVAELSRSTGVPLPFKVEVARSVLRIKQINPGVIYFFSFIYWRR